MPCFSGEIVNNQIIISCLVAKAGKSQEGEKSTLQHCHALIDTGATGSCISDRLASKMELVCERWDPVVGLHGNINTRIYSVSLWFETKVSFSGTTAIKPPGQAGKDLPAQSIGRYMVGGDLEVAELRWEEGDNYDLLIGMDIIREFMLMIHQNDNSFTICI